MKLNKSPGYDGLPLEFYIVFFFFFFFFLMILVICFWINLIIPWIMVFYHFPKEMVLLRSSLKKDKNPLKIENYRSISLPSVDYKIIAETVANRLKSCMGNQSGFQEHW